jgi:glycosyltransferase involved in cell wall biosynthesis
LKPLVSVILPTFNRSRFLPAAFEAIRAQRLTAWELIVVDDGSTDDTAQVVETLTRAIPQPVKYIRQDNQGAYGARNSGVNAARTDYIAFYDSDDLWLPHHLSTCVTALRTHADIDWVYAACEVVDLETQDVIRSSSFYDHGEPRPFMRLAGEVRGDVHVIAGREAIRCQIEHGLFCGLQNSVFRRSVFERLRFATDLRNEAEDQLFVIRAVAAGFRLGYIDDIHVRYQVHSENSSAPRKNVITLEKRRRVFEPLIRGYERLPMEVSLTAPERRALRQRLGREMFWHLGYTGFLESGERGQALEAFARALRLWPWDLRQWKTYLATLARRSVRGERREAPAPDRLA